MNEPTDAHALRVRADGKTSGRRKRRALQVYTERFHFPDSEELFFSVEYFAPHETPDETFHLHLNSGRALEHEGTPTHRGPGLEPKVEDAFVLVPPCAAKRYELEDNDWVRLRSRRGSLKTRAIISPRLREGELYMPVCSSDERVNALSSSNQDAAGDTPFYTEVAVSLEKLDGPVSGRGDGWPSPIPQSNPLHGEHGESTPQSGVRVALKWKRIDYEDPPARGAKGGRV